MDRNSFIDSILKFEGEYEIFIETGTKCYRIYDLNFDMIETEEGEEPNYNYKCNDLGNWCFSNLDTLASHLYDHIQEYGYKVISIDNE